MLNTFSKIILFLLLPIQFASAQLIPIDEAELSEMTGQAFINIDESHDNSSGLDFTKVTLGLDVDTLLNADKLDLGNYDRGGAGSDILIDNFALGKIDSNGNVVPFSIRDPFIELAFDDDAGKQNLVGVRIGFGGAKGALSGTIKSLTGNVNVDIKDTAQALSEADGDFIGDILTALGPSLLGNSPLVASAVLVDSAGNPNSIRASKVGLKNGTEIEIDTRNVNGFSRGILSFTAGILPNTYCVDSSAWFSGPCDTSINFISQGCEVDGGIATCFNLEDYNTLEVGNKKSDGTFDFAEGLSLSFQSERIAWRNSNGVISEKGAFLNVPNGGLEVTLKEALKGTDRVRTRYVDPYF